MVVADRRRENELQHCRAVRLNVGGVITVIILEADRTCHFAWVGAG